jgi:hypothetical protein
MELSGSLTELSLDIKEHVVRSKRVKITIEAYYYINPENYLEDTIEDAIQVDLANIGEGAATDLQILSDVLELTHDLSVNIEQVSERL